MKYENHYYQYLNKENLKMNRKKINEQRMWSFAGLFIIMLVISMPFYSANVMAVSLQISANHGEAGVNNFLDAEGDVWTVQATIKDELLTNGSSISPENVKMNVGGVGSNFDSCSDSSMGVVCEYISPLTNGIQDGEHGFQVEYHYLDGFGNPAMVADGDYIRADGTAPKVTLVSAEQNKETGAIMVDFTINDKFQNAPSVGLGEVKIVNMDTNEVLFSKSDFDEGVTDYSFVDDQNHNGKVNGLSGEGIARLRISAVDKFGHESKPNPVATFRYDLIKPDIQSNSLNLTGLGKFIGTHDVISDVIIDVIEANNPRMKAYSEDADLNGELDSCVLDELEDDLWHCTWEYIEIYPNENIAITFVAIDDYHNLVEKKVSVNQVADVIPPKVLFFGTQYIYEDQSYIKSGENRLILQVEDSGAGIDKDGIRAGLSSFGQGNSVPAQDCYEEGTTLICYWDVEYSGNGNVDVGLTKLRDKVGNEGDMPYSTFFFDNSAPNIQEIEVYGASAAGDKDYIQSNDILKIVFTAAEKGGINVLMNLVELVDSAEEKYPAQELYDLEAGWRLFNSEEICQENEDGLFDCVVETEPVMSGPKDVDVEMKIIDTAGNEVELDTLVAENVEFDKNGIGFEILGLLTEDQPDYWNKGTASMSLDFVDLDVVSMGFSKMPMKVSFSTDNSKVQMLKIKMPEGACTPVGSVIEASNTVGQSAEVVFTPEISRNLMYGTSFGVDGDSGPTTNAVIEFSPFDGRGSFNLGKDVGDTFEQVDVEYICDFLIYSRVGDNAVSTAEIQPVKVVVPFAFSEMGGLDESLAKKIKDVRNSGFMKFADAMSYVQIALDWIKYVLNILQIVVSVNQLIDLFGETDRLKADTLEKQPWTAAIGPVLRGSCMATEYSTKPSWGFVKWIQVPVQILNCNPEPGIDMGFYGTWQKTVLDLYNLASGRGVLGIPADSLYDNMYASMMGLCVPGILFNIEKAREIHCRKIVCYGQEVPSGIATIQSCDKLFDLMMCEFHWGPLFDFVGLGGISAIGKMLKSAVSSPLGLMSLVEVIGCAGICWTKKSKGWLLSCKITTGINKVLGIINSIVSSIDNRPDVTGSPYCKMADSIKVEDLVGQVGNPLVGPAEPLVTDSATPEEVAASIVPDAATEPAVSAET